MSFSIFFPENFSPEQIAFGFSTAHETLIALHVYHDCKHHPLHIPWVINARKKINPALKEEIEAFSIFYSRPLITYWELREESAIRSFDYDLNELSQTSIEQYCQTFFETLLNRKIPDIKDKKVEEELIDFTKKRFPKSTEVVIELLENPTVSRQRFINLLEAFWNACVKEEWPKIEELFLKDISLRGRKLMKEGPLPLFAGLSNSISVLPKERRVVIRRISKKEIHLGEDDMVFLAPTYFAWPHLFVKSHKPIGLNYSILENEQEAAQPVPPENLIKFYRAMGDFTRLQIVKYLAKRPRSTRELAELIGVTDGAISKHLKQLQDAGLIGSKRDSYYVFYHLLEQPFKDIQRGMNYFFE